MIENNIQQNNENKATHYKFLGFPQPPVAAFGSVTDGGALEAKSKPDVTLTSVKAAAGTYTITHNLGNQNYYPMLTRVNAAVGQITCSAKTDTTITVLTATAAGVLTDSAFDFIIFNNY